VILAYIDSMIGMFRAGGFSADLTHHALHALGSRLYGFIRRYSTTRKASTRKRGRC
jgi:hypothetical protein